LISGRDNPEKSFEGQQRETPWDEIHMAYFVGEALWTYFNTPFLYNAQLFGNLFDRGGLLEGMNRVDEGIHHVKQNKHDVFVKMKVAIAGDIAFTADVVKGRQMRKEMLEALDAEELLGVQRFFGL
jgi:hypothetical protein